MNATTIGFDIAKNVFQAHGVDRVGKTVLRRQLKRKEVLPFFAKLPVALIGLEACAGSHYWARELIKLGHDARLISPQFVKALREGEQERRQRCGGDLRSGGAAEHAVCTAKVPGTKGPADAASGSPDPGEGAGGGGQSDTGNVE